MDKKNKKSNDFKNKQNIRYPDDYCKPSTSGYNQHQDRNLKNSKTKRNHSPDNDRNRIYNVVDKKKAKVKDECSVKVQNDTQCNISSDLPYHYQSSNPQQVPHMNPYPNYGYNGPEYFNMELTQRNYPMMANNMYGAVNTPWSCNQVDSMCVPVSAVMDMASNVNENMNGFNHYIPMYNMMGIGGGSPYHMYAPDNIAVTTVKEPITLPHCVLTPPQPGTQIRTRERHPGSKTVFVGGLPENITEELIREIFSQCGNIATVLMSEKNFCHIRFAAMETVDKAMKLSGYRLKIENKEDSSNSGRIHVDFARSRVDDYEWNCLQRAKAREIRHKVCLAQEATCPPTPPPVVDYSEHEANLLSDKLKNVKTCKDAMNVLITWLDRGECNRKTCSSFYSMIQCINSHIKRLVNKKSKTDEELNEAKLVLQEQMREVSLEFNKIMKLFNIVKQPNVWSSLTKSVKESIETIRQDTVGIVEAHSKEVVAERVEDDMELSDDDCNTKNPSVPSKCYSDAEKNVEKIKAEVEALKSQFKAIKEENLLLKKEKESNNSIRSTLINEDQEILKSLQAERDCLLKEEESLATRYQNEMVESSQGTEDGSDQK